MADYRHWRRHRSDRVSILFCIDEGMMTENKYQAKIIKKLEEIFPGCVILKNDPEKRQGMLDLTILWEKHWAVLEVKTSAKASVQPNQEHYIKRLGAMSFAAYIYPENEEEVLSALQQAFESPRRTRVSQS
jgi:hypothetical protein